MRSALPLLLVAAALATPAGTAEAAQPTCRGERATIVGNAGDLFSATGTPGRDVIVTNGARQVTGRGGDDLICVTRAGSATNAGAGDDVVVVQARVRVYAYLGSGDDTYLGSNGRDTVDPEGGRDVVRTFGGADSVTLTSYRPQAVVDLGPGDDRATVGPRSGGSRVHGGPGADLLEVAPAQSRTVGTWRFDSRRGVARADGRVVARWSSMRTYDLHALSGRAERVRFLGSSAVEDVDLSGYAVPRRVRLDLGGGDDAATITGSDRGQVLLGTGHDGLTIARGASAQVDLAQQAAHVVAADGAAYDLALGGVDGVSTREITDVTLVGDADDNVLRAEGVCSAQLRGLAGDDRLDVGATVCAGATQTVVLEGGRGDDVLRGSFLDDLLTGGAGQDLANGEDGTDTCYAEERRACELP